MMNKQQIMADLFPNSLHLTACSSEFIEKGKTYFGGSDNTKMARNDGAEDGPRRAESRFIGAVEAAAQSFGPWVRYGQLHRLLPLGQVLTAAIMLAGSSVCCYVGTIAVLHLVFCYHC